MKLAKILLATLALVITCASYANDWGRFSAFALVDASGKKIGVFYPPPLVSGGPVAVLGLDGTYATVYLEAYQEAGLTDSERLRFSRNNYSLFFASSDCSGPPLIRGVAYGNGTRPATTFFNGTDVILYVGAAGFSSSQSAQSFYTNSACTPGSWLVNAWTLERTVNLTSRFREPLRIVPVH
jgi:hypothetical protein